MIEDQSNENIFMYSDLLHEESSSQEVDFVKRFVCTEYEELLSNLEWEIREKHGEVVYEIGYDESSRLVGLNEEEYEQSLQCVKNLAEDVRAEVSFHLGSESAGVKGCIALIRSGAEEMCSDVRLAVCGNVDAGKSTLIGVLTSSELDNGRGEARTNCFKYPHEFETGRTSSVGYQIVGFNAKGECVNDEEHRKIDWAHITQSSNKIISFIDLAGHEKYFKTTITGMSGHLPDYCLLVVGANMGITRMTKEHLILASSLEIPIIVVVTKIDIAPDNIRKRTLESVRRLAKTFRKTAILPKTEDEILYCLKNVQNNTVIPIFEISNVTGESLDTLKTFFNLLSPRIQWEKLKDNPAEVLIDNIYNIQGVGTVVTGIVVSGTVSPRREMLVGPFRDGTFQKVKVKSCQINHVAVDQVPTGRSGGFAINMKKGFLRKGMYLVDPEVNPVASWGFQAKIVVLSTSTSTIRTGYSPVVQCMGFRQSSRISAVLDKEMIRTGERGTVNFNFMYRPEYIKSGMRIILADGKSKAFGVITSVDADCK